MHGHAYVERFINLLDPAANLIFNMSVAEAEARVGSGDPAQIREIEGQFALVHRSGRTIRMARSIGRPMRYFLAKQVDGPCLIVAERIDQIADWLRQEGLDGQFHPSYTRMVPAALPAGTVTARLSGSQPWPDPLVYSRAQSTSGQHRRDRSAVHRNAAA